MYNSNIYCGGRIVAHELKKAKGPKSEIALLQSSKGETIHSQKSAATNVCHIRPENLFFIFTIFFYDFCVPIVLYHFIVPLFVYISHLNIAIVRNGLKSKSF